MEQAKKEKIIHWTWRTVQALILVALLSPLIFIVLGKWMITFDLDVMGKTLEVDLFAYWKFIKVWRWYYNIPLWGGAIGFGIAAVFYVKFLYMNRQRKIREVKEMEVKQEGNKELKKLNKRIESVLGSK